MSIEDEDVSTASQYSGYDEVGVTTGIGSSGSQGEGGGRQDGPGSVNFGVTGAGTGTGAVIQPTRFNLNNNPNSTTITRSPLQQFRFNRDAERASRVVSYTPANIAEFEAATGRTRNNFSPNRQDQNKPIRS